MRFFFSFFPFFYLNNVGGRICFTLATIVCPLGVTGKQGVNIYCIIEKEETTAVDLRTGSYIKLVALDYPLQ